MDEGFHKDGTSSSPYRYGLSRDISLRTHPAEIGGTRSLLLLGSCRFALEIE
jgi:hypothetical protein